jgi:hypothetical protein
MNGKQTQFDWAFGWQWLVLCALGTACGALAAYVIMWTVGEAVGEVTQPTLGLLTAGTLFGALIALGANLGPGWLLRSKGINGMRWILFSVVAGAIGTGLTFTILSETFERLSEFASSLAIGLSLGLPVGIGQWLVLRRQSLPAGGSANAWPLISMAAYIRAGLAVVNLSGDGREWIALSVMGLSLGSITGLGMAWIMRRQVALAV